MTQKPFTQLIRIRYAECDAQQVVFNARYIDYADVAFTEFTREVWGGMDTIFARGLDSQVVSVAVDWTSSAVFDDVIAIEVECDHIGNTSFGISFTMLHQLSQRNIAKARIVYVMVDSKNFKKCRIPPDLMEALQNGAPGVLNNQAG